jgi:hypothetical protein
VCAPEIALRVQGIVGAAQESKVLERRRAAERERLLVMDFEPPSLLAAVPARVLERATRPVTTPNRAADLGWYVAAAPQIALPNDHLHGRRRMRRASNPRRRGFLGRPIRTRWRGSFGRFTRSRWRGSTGVDFGHPRRRGSLGSSRVIAPNAPSFSQLLDEHRHRKLVNPCHVPIGHLVLQQIPRLLQKLHVPLTRRELDPVTERPP